MPPASRACFREKREVRQHSGKRGLIRGTSTILVVLAVCIIQPHTAPSDSHLSMQYQQPGRAVTARIMDEQRP